MLAVVIGIYAMANLIVWGGTKICARRGHRWLESDEHLGHKFCGCCHVDFIDP